MKTKEFIEKALDLGFIVVHGSSQDNVEIIFSINGVERLIAKVNKKIPYILNTDLHHFYSLNIELKNKLLNLLYFYSITPIEDREEPKRYRINFCTSVGKTVMKFKHLNEVTYFHTYDEEKEFFTREEIEKYGMSGLLKSRYIKLVEVTDNENKRID